MGSLIIVATPIGNLKDITFRAVEILKNVDYILCEDTRITGNLLSAYDIHKKLSVINDFNEERVIDKVIGDLLAGKRVALVSDAGTPLVSDPGFKLVRAARSKNINVETAPGPVAAIAALVISGLPCDKFIFLGFLPKKDGKRIELLKNIKMSISCVKSTVIIYESPFRVLKTLEQIQQVFGDIKIVVVRELTKMHEEIVCGNISNILDKIKTKGELVILF